MASPAVEVLATMAAENLNHLREERPANMSRRRFAVTQINSLIIAFLTCVSLVCIWTLTRVESMNDLFLGPCGLAMLLIRNLTGTTQNISCSIVT